MKLLKWLLPVIIIIIVAPYSSAQINLADSTALINLRDKLGLSTVPSLASNIVSTWAPAHIDTSYDAVNGDYRITGIDFSALASTSPSILPDNLFDGDTLNQVRFLFLDNIGIDSIEGFLRNNTSGTAPLIREIDLSFNDFPSGNGDFFNYLISNLPNLEILKTNTVFLPPSTAFTNYVLPASSTLEHLDIKNNDFIGTLDLANLTGTPQYPNLKFFHADDNDFTALIAPLSASSILEEVYIQGLSLLDFKPIETLLNNVPSIKELHAKDAMDNSLSDSLEFSITTPLTNLKVLDISNNQLRGVLPADLFERLSSIEVLYINDNSIRGFLPTPAGNISSGPITGSAYLGLANLIKLDISHNELKGELRIDWLFLKQLADLATTGASMPLTSFNANDNDFNELKPVLNNATVNTILNSSQLSNRFSSLEELTLEDNRLDFKDLFRARKIFRLKQLIGTTFFTHYIPQNGNDSTDFQYAPQEDIGIGGVRRRTPGSRLTIAAGLDIIAAEQTTTNYMGNQYNWQRIDTSGIVGGTATSPIIQALGRAEQIGTSVSPSLAANNTSGDPSYLFGVDTTAANIHKLAVQNLDSANHNGWLYQAEIRNDSFPLLELRSIPKKIEVGYCTDSSGARVHCQSMIVQFHPDTLALYNPQQQDSLKKALRDELGAEPIDECLCGDIELWSISDTAKAMLEANGKGTKQSATRASGKPQLLSADPNYSLLGSTSNTLPDTVNLPAGSGNSSAKTLVAIIDSGVDYEYTALTPYISEGASSSSACLPNATFGYNFVDDNNNATDDHGHGTAVAGIVAGISQQSILPDTGSMQTDIGILPLKYTNKEGEGSVFHAACAFRYAADYERSNTAGQTAKVKVINASWGYYGDPCIVLENVLKYVGEDCGILVVASAGNDGIQVQGSLANRHWPSNSIFDPTGTLAIDNILSVAGLNQNETALNSLSNYGNVHIDLAAPWFETAPLAGSMTGFSTVEGTSFAAPQVARAAALLFDKYPDATYFAVKYALMNGVDVLQHTDSSKIVSKGKINFHKADSILNRITNRFSCSDSSFILDITPIESIDHQVNIYPNPVNDQLTIEVDYQLTANKIEINLFNLQGQSLQAQQLGIGTTTATIQTRELPAGVYFIQLSIGDKQYSKKLIKF